MNKNLYNKILIVAGVFCLICAYVIVSSFHGEFGKDTANVATVNMMPETVDAKEEEYAGNEKPSEAPQQVHAVAGKDSKASVWVIYVTGAVKNPGVYEVKPGARVYEALKAAGGFAANADNEAVNLAAKIEDGQHIKFVYKGESVDTRGNQNTEEVRSNSVKANHGSLKKDVVVNINTATADELVAVRGIGPKMAQWIIDYRAQNGNFTSIEEIINVRGIGAKRYKEIKDKITVGQ